MNGNLRTNTRFTRKTYGFADDEVFYPETDGEPMAETDKHRDLMVELIESLKIFYAEDAEIYVTGDLLLYYLEGVPQECVAPDVMVCFGVTKQERRIYKLWEEKVAPSVIIEIASHSTYKNDREGKRELYESLGVNEYFIYNPEYPKTLPSLLAYRLENGEFQKIRLENNRVFSAVLGLDLVDTGKTLRLFNPQTTKFLPSLAELALAEERAELEKDLRIKAEAEIKQLKAELAKLKNG